MNISTYSGLWFDSLHRTGLSVLEDTVFSPFFEKKCENYITKLFLRDR